MRGAYQRARDHLVPASVLLTVTHKCQLACAHCYQAQHDSEDLSTAELVQLMDELEQLGTLALTFSGGEALIRKDLFELIAEARKRHFAVTLFSNGGPITPEVAKKLRALRVFLVELSLHAAHPEAHDAFVGRKGTFARAVRAVELLDDEGVPVLVKTSVTRHNAGEVTALEALFAQRPRVRSSSDVLLHKRDDGKSNVFLRVTEGQLHDYFADRVRGLSTEALGRARRSLAVIPDEAKLDATAPCGAGRTFAVVQPSGDVLACSHLDSQILGNLRKTPFSQIWLSSPEASRLRALTLSRYAECRGCEYRHVCSKCPALSHSDGGALDAHSRQICERTKAFWGAVKERTA